MKNITNNMLTPIIVIEDNKIVGYNDSAVNTLDKQGAKIVKKQTWPTSYEIEPK